jgi:hypothetical protein
MRVTQGYHRPLFEESKHSVGGRTDSRGRLGEALVCIPYM